MNHGSRTDASTEAWTIRRLLDWIREALSARDVDAPRVCAELLVGHVLGLERLALYMQPDRIVTDEELATLRPLVARASRHEPVQFLVGEWPFFARTFEVAPSTLIPRPATETLVELALAFVRTHGAERAWRVADIGTGTGCIGVSLAASIDALRRGRVSDRAFAALDERARTFEKELAAAATNVPVVQIGGGDDVPADGGANGADEAAASEPPAVDAAESAHAAPGDLAVVLTDIVPEALALASRNAKRHGVAEIVETRVGSLFEALERSTAGSYHVIAANPPYISDAEFEQLEPNVREHEPASALRGGADGLDLVRPIVAEAPRWLRRGGLLLVEIAASHADAVLALARAQPDLRDAAIVEDHEGYPRVLRARRG